MSSITERILEISRQVDDRAQRKHKAEGALEQVMAQILKDFECDNLEDAEELCRQMIADSEKKKKSIIQQTEKLEQELEIEAEEEYDDEY